MAIKEMQDLLADPHLLATGFWERRDTADGSMRFPGIPTRFSATPGAIGTSGPVLGEDTRAVLAEAGLSGTEIDALIASRAALDVHREPLL